MSRSIRLVLFATSAAGLLFSLAVIGRVRGQDSGQGKTPAPVNTTTSGPITGLLGTIQADGKPYVPPQVPVLMDGKPWVYPPETIKEARDPRRFDPDVSVAVTLAKAEYRVLEPIPIKVEVRNNASEEKRGGRTTTLLYRVVHVNAYLNEDVQGRWAPLAPKTMYEKALPDSCVFGLGTLYTPGRRTRYEVFANLANDMSLPGVYSLFVEFETGGHVEVDGKMTPRVARSAEFKVNIVDFPRTFPTGEQVD